MIDYFALALTHALLVLAFFRLAGNERLDREDNDAADVEPIRKRRGPGA